MKKNKTTKQPSLRGSPKGRRSETNMKHKITQLITGILVGTLVVGVCGMEVQACLHPTNDQRPTTILRARALDERKRQSDRSSAEANGKELIALNADADRLMEYRKYGESEQLLLKALRKDPNYKDTLSNLARLYVKMSRYNKAIEYADRALKIDRGNIHAYVAKVRALNGLRRFKDAQAACDRPLEADPLNVALHTERLRAIGGHKDKGAKQILIEIVDEGNNERLDANLRHRIEEKIRLRCIALNKEARGLIHARRHEDAGQLLLVALGLDSENSYTFGNLAMVFAGMRNHRQAVIYADKAIAIYPRAGSLYVTKSQSLRALGMLRDAEEACAAGLRYDPRNAALHKELALVKGQEMPDESSARYDRHEDPKNRNPKAIDTVIERYARVGSALAFSQINYPLGSEFYDIAIDNCKADAMLDRLHQNLFKDGGRIQVIFVDSEDDLPEFQESPDSEPVKVWGHAGTYITVFALTGEETTEEGRRKIIGRIFHEIRARSTLLDDLYNDAKTRPATRREATAALARFERDNNLIQQQIEQHGRITNRRLAAQFTELRFDPHPRNSLRDYKGDDEGVDKIEGGEVPASIEDSLEKIDADEARSYQEQKRDERASDEIMEHILERIEGYVITHTPSEINGPVEKVILFPSVYGPSGTDRMKYVYDLALIKLFPSYNPNISYFNLRNFIMGILEGFIAECIERDKEGILNRPIDIGYIRDRFATRYTHSFSRRAFYRMMCAVFGEENVLVEGEIEDGSVSVVISSLPNYWDLRSGIVSYAIDFKGAQDLRMLAMTRALERHKDSFRNVNIVDVLEVARPMLQDDGADDDKAAEALSGVLRKPDMDLAREIAREIRNALTITSMPLPEQLVLAEKGVAALSFFGVLHAEIGLANKELKVVDLIAGDGAFMFEFDGQLREAGSRPEIIGVESDFRVAQKAQENGRNVLNFDISAGEDKLTDSRDSVDLVVVRTPHGLSYRVYLQYALGLLKRDGLLVIQPAASDEGQAHSLIDNYLRTMSDEAGFRVFSVSRQKCIGVYSGGEAQGDKVYIVKRGDSPFRIANRVNPADFGEMFGVGCIAGEEERKQKEAVFVRESSNPQQSYEAARFEWRLKREANGYAVCTYDPDGTLCGLGDYRENWTFVARNVETDKELRISRADALAYDFLTDEEEMNSFLDHRKIKLDESRGKLRTVIRYIRYFDPELNGDTETLKDLLRHKDDIGDKHIDAVEDLYSKLENLSIESVPFALVEARRRILVAQNAASSLATKLQKETLSKNDILDLINISDLASKSPRDLLRARLTGTDVTPMKFETTTMPDPYQGRIYIGTIQRRLIDLASGTVKANIPRVVVPLDDPLYGWCVAVYAGGADIVLDEPVDYSILDYDARDLRSVNYYGPARQRIVDRLNKKDVDLIPFETVIAANRAVYIAEQVCLASGMFGPGVPAVVVPKKDPICGWYLEVYRKVQDITKDEPYSQSRFIENERGEIKLKRFPGPARQRILDKLEGRDVDLVPFEAETGAEGKVIIGTNSEGNKFLLSTGTTKSYKNVVVYPVKITDREWILEVYSKGSDPAVDIPDSVSMLDVENKKIRGVRKKSKQLFLHTMGQI